MNINDLKELGFSEDDILQRVVDAIADRVLLGELSEDYDGDMVAESSSFARKLKDKIHERIDEAVENLAEKHTLPNINEYLENLTIQSTNQWGERKGESLTLIEYLTKKAEGYLTEDVNHQGKSKKEDNYNWRASNTRVGHLINKKIHFQIESAIEGALKELNNGIAEGLDGVVKIQLQNVLDNLKVTKTVVK